MAPGKIFADFRNLVVTGKITSGTISPDVIAEFNVTNAKIAAMSTPIILLTINNNTSYPDRTFRVVSTAQTSTGLRVSVLQDNGYQSDISLSNNRCIYYMVIDSSAL